MVRVGIVGSGGMGSVHARQYRKRKDVDLFFYDHNVTRAAKFEERFSAKATASIEALIESVDVIDICLPTPAHTEIGLKSVAAGRPTLIEKPLCRTLEEAVALAEASVKANVPVMPAHVLRFFPEYAQAHAVVKSGKIGTPGAARLRRGAGVPGGSDGWFLDHSKSGGVLLDLSIHDFDWLRWTMGEVKHLYSKSVGIAKGSGPDYALTTLTFENGCVAHVEGTWMDPGGFRTTLEVAGSSGLIQHDSRQNASLRTTLAPKPSEGAPLPNLEGGLFELDDPYYLEIDAFLKAATGNGTVPITVEDGLAAVSISLAAIESAKTGKVITPARHF